MVSYKNALTSLWTGRADIYNREAVLNTGNGRNEPQERLKSRAVPCRLSYKAIPSVSEQDGAAVVAQTVTMFIGREAEVPPGSKVVVTQNGVTEVYAASGKPAVYTHHQEITLEVFKGWA